MPEAFVFPIDQKTSPISVYRSKTTTEVNMNPNNSNTSKGCLSWVNGLAAVILGLLTAAASCAGIMQYINSAAATPTPPPNPVIVITGEPASNPSNAQASVVNVSAEDWQAVENFLGGAVVAEIAAYQYNDASYASMFYGDALQSIQNQILDLSSRGVFRSARFDYDNSYIYDIRFGQNNRIEVDSCEYWASDYYDQLTGNLLGSDDWALVPQTIVIENVNAGYYVTSIAFYTGQAFC